MSAARNGICYETARVEARRRGPEDHVRVPMPFDTILAAQTELRQPWGHREEPRARTLLQFRKANSSRRCRMHAPFMPRCQVTTKANTSAPHLSLFSSDSGTPVLGQSRVNITAWFSGRPSNDATGKHFCTCTCPLGRAQRCLLIQVRRTNWWAGAGANAWRGWPSGTEHGLRKSRHQWCPGRRRRQGSPRVPTYCETRGGSRRMGEGQV